MDVPPNSGSSNSGSSSPDASTPWSSLIAERYQCRVDPALAAFWDDGIWQAGGEGEFCVAVPPESLLEPFPESLWPGLMPCHQIPILENDRGDCLAVRLGGDNCLQEVVHWFHGGGDWVPWGDNVAQALMFNRMAPRLPGFDRRHCVDAEPLPEPTSEPSSAWSEFAASHTKAFDHREPSPIRLAESMLAAGVASTAVLAGLVAAQFDHYQIESWIASALAKNPNLAWVWEAAGRRVEAQGRSDEAIDFYQRGARCSVFTSQSVRMQTHAGESDVTKFSVSKLKSLAPDLVAEDPYLRGLALPSLADQQQAAGEYWGKLADGFEDGSPEQLFSLHMSGWDLGRNSMSQCAEVIRAIIDCATAGEMTGRAEIARVHLQTLRHRYG